MMSKQNGRDVHHLETEDSKSLSTRGLTDFNLQVNTSNIQKCTTWPTGLQVYSIITVQHTANIS